jgi:chitin synthase
MVGAKYICFGLDTNWLTGKWRLPLTICCLDDKSGSNFHIFYYLLSGLESSEKHALYLGEKSEHYAYLNNGLKHDQDAQKDAQSFSTLQENLKSLGIGRRQQSQLFKLMAGIFPFYIILFSNS